MKKSLREILSAIPPTEYLSGGRIISDQVHAAPVGDVINETIIKLLKPNPTKGSNKIYMGYGGFINFDYVCHLNPSGAIFCDINKRQELFWPAFFQLMKECETPETLLKGFSVSRKMEFKDIREKERLMPYVESDSKHMAVWLKDPKKYKKLRDMIIAGNICELTIDVLDSERHEQLHKVLRVDNALEIDWIYLSNIIYFIKQKQALGERHGNLINNALGKKLTGDFYRSDGISDDSPAALCLENQVHLCSENTQIIRLTSSPRDSVMGITDLMRLSMNERMGGRS